MPSRTLRTRRFISEPLEARRLLASDPLLGAALLAPLADGGPESAALSTPTIEQLSGMVIAGDTAHKPQSKTWKHDGYWWSVLSNASGTFVWRLDGTAWTSVLQLTADNVHADVKPAGDLVHVLLEDNEESELASLEYVPGSPGTYQLWSGRPTLTPVALASAAESATLDLDSTGRMWIASDVTNSIEVRYADAPYSSFSAPFTLVSNINSDDLSALVAMPGGKIGVMWSNQSTDRFGFRVHNDSDPPDVWAADEVPASQSAQSVGLGMADDHINVTAAADGTLYAAVKTSFSTPGYPSVALLVRRPNGTWDDLYAVDELGTNPIVDLNETLNTVLVIYRNTGSDGPIVFKESPLASISFGPRQTLVNGNSVGLPTSTKQSFTSDLVVLASHSGNLSGARLTYDLPPTVSAGPDQNLAAGVSIVLDGSADDDGQPNPPGSLTAAWTRLAGPGEATFVNPAALDTTVGVSVAGAYQFRLSVSDGANTVTDDVTVTVADSPGNTAPTVDAGPTATVELSAGATLDGTVSDDDLPAPPAVGVQWRKVSGPGTVSFGNALAVDTTASFSALGTYVLRLEAQDGALLASDTVTINVVPDNQAPSVSAGPDQIVLQAAGAALNGTVMDDGLPNPPAALTTLWSVVDGPGSVTFGNASAVDTTALFGALGTYVLRLSAHDSALGASDEVTIQVVDVYPNDPPVVQAGVDQTVSISAGAALNGTVTDDGFPIPPGATTSAWSVVSGPGTVMFGDAAAVDTTATFSQTGVYLLRLTADDGALTGEDTVMVTVTSPPTPATYEFQDGALPTTGYTGTRDAKIKSDNVLTNYATTTSLDVDGSPDVASLFKWDLSGIASGAVVQSASLTFNVTNTTVDTYQIYTLLRDWTETGVTWNDFAVGSPWQTPGADGALDRGTSVLGSFTAPATGLISVPLTAAGLTAVQSWIDAPSGNFGLIVQNYTSASDQVTLSSSEVSTVTNRPKLTVNVLEPPPPLVNLAPVVSAGPDQQIMVSGTAVLDGTVSDDGLPFPPGTIVTTWTVVSGPGTVNFGNATAVDTTATFSAAGVYVLRLAAFDGSLSASDDVVVTVGSPPVTASFQNGVLPSAGYTGMVDTMLRSNKPANNSGNATKLTVDGSPDTVSLLRWDLSSLPAGATVQSASITFYIHDASTGSYELYGMNRAWTENQAHWTQAATGSAWQIPGAAGAADRDTTVLGSITPTTIGFHTLPLNAAGLAVLAGWLNDPATNHGLALLDDLVGDSAGFHSSEHSTLANRPKLTLTYTVGPAMLAAPLADAALVALADESTNPLANSQTAVGSAASALAAAPRPALSASQNLLLSRLGKRSALLRRVL